jgi:hypothetical protein
MKNRYLKFKKGFIGDVLTILIIVFILGFFILIGKLILTNVNDRFQADTTLGAQAQTIVNTSSNKYTNLWDGIFIFVFVGLSIASIISAYFIDTHPLMLPLMLVILAFFIFLSAIMSNTFYNIESSNAFVDFAETFKIMHYVMSHLPIYIAIEGFMVMVALFGKSNQG